MENPSKLHFKSVFRAFDRMLLLVLIALQLVIIAELRSGKVFGRGERPPGENGEHEQDRDREIEQDPALGRSSPRLSVPSGRQNLNLAVGISPDPALMVLDREWDRLMRTPAMDMAELSDAYVVLFGIPGVGRPEVDVRLNGSVLTVRMDVVNRRQGSRHSGQILRQIRLPWPVAPGVAPSYSLSNGVLRVRVPK